MRFAKLAILLPIGMLFFSLCAHAQGQPPPVKDDGFDLFLLSLGTIFVCTMIGAAIVGAFLAALFLLTLFALLSAGVLSASFAVGLYKRSISSGFKAFLLFVFGPAFAVLGAAGLWAAHAVFHFPMQTENVVLLGLSGGFIAGMLTALVTFEVIRLAIRKMTTKLGLLQ